MTNLPAERSASLPALSIEPSRDALEWTVGRVKSLLAHFWTPDHDEALEEAVLDDWLAVLEGVEERWIEGACVAYLRSPRKSKTGAAQRPLPSDIYSRALLLRHEHAERVVKGVAEPEGEPRVRVSREKALEILAENGFTPGMAVPRMPTPKRFGKVGVR